MATTTLTELNDLAKDFYSTVYSQLVNEEVPLKAQFNRLENAQFTGRTWIFGVKTEIGGGSANVEATKTLPAATQGTYDQGQQGVVRTYTVMALDGLVIEVTKRQAGSYRPALAEVMADRLAAHDLEVNRQLYVQDATVCLFNGDPGTGTTLTVDADYGVVGANGTRHLYPGDVIEAYDPTLVTQRAGGPYTITSVDSSTAATVTPAFNAAILDDDAVVRATTDTDNAIAGENPGLLTSVAASGTLHSIPGTGRWTSTVFANGGTARPISDSLVMQMLESIRSKSRMLPDLIVTSPGIVLKYSEIFLPLRRLDGQDVQLKGGYKPIAAVVHAGGSIPVISDLDCPRGRMFFLNTRGFRMADLVGTEFADLDGAQFDRIVNQDAITGYIRKYWALINVFRSAHGVIEDLEEVVIEKR
jgi:hypothetical protein